MAFNLLDNKAISEFDTSRGMYLEVVMIGGEEHLSVMKPVSWFGLIIRKISMAYGLQSGTLRKVAKFLKEHEKEILKLNIDPTRKDLLKEKLMKYERNHNVLFTCTNKLFGERTGIYTDHQAKLKQIIDNSPIIPSDISNRNKSRSVFSKFLENFGYNLWECKTSAEQQQQIGKILQKAILPIYKTRMPEQSTCILNPKDSERTVLKYGTLTNKLRRIFSFAKVPARETHGSMHATRVAFWSQVLIQVYKQYGKDSISNPILVGVGGGFHDTARESEGKDYWDPESGQLFDHFLKKMGLNESERKANVQPVSEKDPENGNFTSDFQEIIHDADCLDIIRCVGSRFNPKYLRFFNFKESVAFSKTQFVKEAADFIKLTDRHQVRALFEVESEDFYGDLIRLMFQLQHKQPTRFPIITKLIGEQMACYRNSMNAPFVNKIAKMV